MAWKKVVTESIAGKIAQQAANVTTNANSTGDVTSVGNATTYANAVPIAKGGTGQTTTATGDLLFANGVGSWSRLAVGADDTVLTLDGGEPVWAEASQGDITSVVAGTGLTGGATSGAATVNVVGGTGITANANDIALTAAGAGAASYGSTADGTKIDTITLDAYGRVTAVATGSTGSTSNAGDITGITAGSGISGSSLTGPVPTITLDLTELQQGTGLIPTEDEIIYIDDGVQKKMVAEDVNLSAFSNDQNWTAAETKSTINALGISAVGNIQSGSWNASVISVDKGGTGATATTGTGNNVLSANPSFSGTVATAAVEVQGEPVLTEVSVIEVSKGGTGATAKTGTGSNVLSVSPTFTGTIGAASLTLSGDLTVSGTTTTINTNELTIDDNLITLNSNATGTTTPNVDAGIEIERGSRTNTNIMWDEGENYWTQRVQLSSANDTVGIAAMIPMVESATTGTGGNAVAPGNFFVNTNTNSLYVNV